MPSPIQEKAHRVQYDVRSIEAIATHIVTRMPNGGAGGTAAILGITQGIGRLGEIVRALHQLGASPNPEITEAAHTKLTAASSDKLKKAVDVFLQQSEKHHRDGHANVEKQIREKAKLVPLSDPFEKSELRTVFRAMPKKEQHEFLNMCIEKKLGAELAALLNAPGILTGLTEAERQNYEAAYVAKHAPGELLDRQALNEAYEAAQVAAETARKVAAAFTDPATLAEIARAEAAAAAAEKKFNTTVGA